VLVPLVIVGLVSFVFIRSHAGDGGTVLSRQQDEHGLTPSAVAKVVRAAPDPVAEPTRARGLVASCVASGGGGLLNPWRCSIRYRSSHPIEYLVVIHTDGSYTGDHEFVRYRGRSYRDTGEITGCCISIP
jgi:hypothetical protein